MKIKSSLVTGLVIAFGMAVTAPIQAACCKNQPGWHMVSKKCNIKPAETWQEYNSGIYTPPQSSKGMLFLGR